MLKVDRQALFEDLYSQVHALHTNWRMYVTFYGSRESIDVVRRAAHFTFGRIQRLLFDAIVLGLDTLLEESETRGHVSASIDTLLRCMSEEENKTVGRQLRRDLKHIRSYCQEIFDYRNSLVAHRNLKAALEIEPPDAIKFRTVTNAIKDISALLNRVCELYGAGLPCDFHPEREPDVFDANLLLERLARLT